MLSTLFSLISFLQLTTNIYGLSVVFLLANRTITIPIKTAPKIAKGIRPAPKTIPSLIDQNKNAISIGSFIALLKRTIESAPTIPSERTTLEVTPSIINVVINVSASKDIAKVDEYITPLNVFL